MKERLKKNARRMALEREYSELDLILWIFFIWSGTKGYEVLNLIIAFIGIFKALHIKNTLPVPTNKKDE